MKKFLLLMLLAPAALSAAADSGADASVVVRKDSAFVEKHRFLPTAKRIDRRIDRNKFAYKGEVALGITASYGTISSDDTDMMLILDHINLDGTMAQVNPFVGYFYRDNNMVGLRLGYRHIGMGLGNLKSIWVLRTIWTFRSTTWTTRATPTRSDSSTAPIRVSTPRAVSVCSPNWSCRA